MSTPVAGKAANLAPRVTPDEWAAQLSGPADLSSERGMWGSALIRHWTGTSPDMDQPPLDHHYVVQHLGGPKHVERRYDGKPISTLVDNYALTIVPAGTQFKWRTKGPIEFAHLYIAPGLLSRTGSRFDKANEISLIDRVGFMDPLLSTIFSAMLQEVREPCMLDALYLDSLLEPFMLRLLVRHASKRLRSPRARETLAPFRVKRVIDFIETRLDGPLALADLAGVSGGSPFHFCRSFKNSTGETPYRYLVRRRVERAKQMLSGTDLTLSAIARACGFSGVTSFCKTFTRVAGDTPPRFRNQGHR